MLTLALYPNLLNVSYMYKNKQQFYAGDGIVAHSVDETIQNIGTLGSQGMLQTNDKIIEMMISCD